MKKTPAKRSAAKRAPAKRTTAKRTTPTKSASAKKRAATRTPAKRVATKPASSPTRTAYRLLRSTRKGAKNLDPVHRKDGLALLLLGSALIVAAGTWAHLQGPVGDLVEILVTGSVGRLGLLVPVLLVAIAVRFIRHKRKAVCNGRVVIGLSVLVIGTLGLVHIACGSPTSSESTQAIRDAGGLIGWGVATALTYSMGNVLAASLLVLLIVFGLLVVTATPVNAIPQRLRAVGTSRGIVQKQASDQPRENNEGHTQRLTEASPPRTSQPRPPIVEADKAVGVEQETLLRRGKPKTAATAASTGAQTHRILPSPRAVPHVTNAPLADMESERRVPTEQRRMSNDSTYSLPALDLLTSGGPGKARSAANDAVVASLQNVFMEFKVDAAVTGFTRGP
ncbi:DNA translocase FtsK 4TM domain-containing protein, partial [Streptomyces sp. NPDC052287]|uniref:DNA translocase FtsK 4TM domain-containing protein n=1 Tax=Streptomyces sp. NPDC052287 TaxID=3154950 RepID=UPI003433A480